VSGDITKKGKRFDFLKLKSIFTTDLRRDNSFNHLAPLRPNTHKGEVAALNHEEKALGSFNSD